MDHMFQPTELMKYQSEQVDLLAAAISKMQSELGGAKKDGNNPFFDSNYATLESCWEALRGPLTKNGLSVIQAPWCNDRFYIRTVILHESGQWIASFYPIVAKDETPQAYGSAVTYARRYSLCSMVGIYQADDDGNAAQNWSGDTQNKTNKPFKVPAFK